MPNFAVVATETFTGTDGAFPANFTDLDTVNGQVQIQGNKFRNPYPPYSGARHTGTYTDDHSASVVVSGFIGSANGDAIGAICRAGTGVDTARSFYFVYVTDNTVTTVTYGKVVAGVLTNFALDSTVTTWANGDVPRIYVLGTSIVVQKNGVDILSTTDGALTTGKPGILARAGASEVLRGDDAEFCNVTAGAGAALSGSALTVGAGTAAPSISIGL